MSHTPGPWFRRTSKQADGRHVEWITASEGTGVKSDHYMSVSGCISNEDANLIAAAPNLLAVLEAIVLETMPFSPIKSYSADSYLPTHLIEQAQCAIKKARGEA